MDEGESFVKSLKWSFVKQDKGEEKELPANVALDLCVYSGNKKRRKSNRDINVSFDLAR